MSPPDEVIYRSSNSIKFIEAQGVPKGRRSVLVADPDPLFLEALRSDPKTKSIPLLTATTGYDAQSVLAAKEWPVAAIFVNVGVKDPHGLSVIRCAHIQRPATPVYLLRDGGPLPFDKEDIDRLGIQREFSKPLTYASMLASVLPGMATFNPEEAVAASGAPDEPDGEVDGEFVGILAAHFVAGTRSFFDVYVRLASGRFVKILKAGDSFSLDRLEAYLRKGVRFLYLKKNAQEHYIQYCDHLASSLNQTSAPAEVKLRQSLSQGEATLDFLRSQGLNEANIQYASNFIENVDLAARAQGFEKNDSVRDFFANVAAYGHGVAVSAVASLLIRPLQIEAQKPVQVVGFAALFHDLGLFRLLPDLDDEDEEKMDAQQLALYQMHPTVSSRIISDIRGISPVTAQAVLQHHERRNRKGFPSKLGPEAINRVAEIVAVSDEVVKLVKRVAGNPKLDFTAEIEKKVLPHFSVQLIDAFRSVFTPRKLAAELQKRKAG
jgi:response regulator RpfG family c-di-GMP phosphodiesterase